MQRRELPRLPRARVGSAERGRGASAASPRVTDCVDGRLTAMSARSRGVMAFVPSRPASPALPLTSVPQEALPAAASNGGEGHMPSRDVCSFPPSDPPTPREPIRDRASSRGSVLAREPLVPPVLFGPPSPRRRGLLVVQLASGNRLDPLLAPVLVRFKDQKSVQKEVHLASFSGTDSRAI